VDSELEILKSRSNVEKVVANLHLDWQVDQRSKGVSFTPLEFFSSAESPVFKVELLGAGNYEVKDEDGNRIGTGASGVLMRGKGVTLLIKNLSGEKGDSFRISLVPFNETVADVRRGIRAAAVGKRSNVISVTYRDRDQLLARDVVNALVAAYLEQGIAIKAEEATRTIGFVQEQLKGTKEELETAEKNLQAYKSASGIIQLDAEAENVITSLTGVEKQKADTTLQRKQVEFALASLQDSRRSGSVYSPANLRDDPLVAGMAARLVELEVQKRGLLSDSTENHPAVKSVQAQIDEIQKKIQTTYETALNGMRKQEANISREIAMHDSRLKRLPAAERDLARLMRISKVNADIYTFLLQKFEEARVAKASTISNVQIVDSAITPDRPISPNKKKNLLFGVVVGTVLGVGLCFFREYLDDTLKNPEEARRRLDLPLLALIPFIPGKEGVESMVSHHAPKSVASEAFRSLRTALHFSTLKKQKQVMLITSSFGNEGKTTVACNLAITLAQTGAKVLIVDCDLRRSMLQSKLGAAGEGLTELLSGELFSGDVLHATEVENLDIVRSGAIPPNPAELLGSDVMARFIEEMRDIYAYIVIDAPPVLAVTDSTVLTALVDLVIVVLEPGRVPAQAARRTKEVLMAVEAPVAGIVVSDRKAQAVGCGYRYGYEYPYGDEVEKKPWWKLGKA